MRLLFYISPNDISQKVNNLHLVEILNLRDSNFVISEDMNKGLIQDTISR